MDSCPQRLKPVQFADWIAAVNRCATPKAEQKRLKPVQFADWIAAVNLRHPKAEQKHRSFGELLNLAGEGARATSAHF